VGPVGPGSELASVVVEAVVELVAATVVGAGALVTAAVPPCAALSLEHAAATRKTMATATLSERRIIRRRYMPASAGGTHRMRTSGSRFVHRTLGTSDQLPA
jgi:hypothetical protein